MNLAEEVLDNNGMEWAKWLALPVVGLVTHVVIDRAISEGYQGAWQVDIGLAGVLAAYLGQPTAKRRDNVARAALWSAIIPDSVLKSQLHPPELNSLPTIFEYTRDNTQLAELVCLNGILAFSFNFKLE